MWGGDFGAMRARQTHRANSPICFRKSFRPTLDHALPADELMVLLAHSQHGTWRMADDPLGGASQEYVSQARIAVRRDDDQIRFQSPRRISDFAVGSAGSHKLLLNDTLVQ